MDAMKRNEAPEDTVSELRDVKTGYLKKMKVLTSTNASKPPLSQPPLQCTEHFREIPPQTTLQRIEHKAINTIETLVFSMDNITTIQAFFPSILNYKSLKPLNWGIEQVNKLYLLYLALQLRKSVARYVVISRLQRFVKKEWGVLHNYNEEIKQQMQKQLVEWTRELQSELWVCRMNITSYFVDLVLNIGLVLKKRGKTMKLLAALSYLFALLRNGPQEEESETVITLQSRYKSC